MTRHRGRSALVILAILGALTLTACAKTGNSASSPEPTRDASANAQPDGNAEPILEASSESYQFAGTKLDGSTFNGTQLAGRPSVLWFWAPWCHVCKGQIPDVEKLGQTYSGRVNVLAVGGLDTAASVKQAAADISDVTHLVDPEGEIWKHFAIAEQSVFVVLDADGNVVESGHMSATDLKDTVAGLVS